MCMLDAALVFYPIAAGALGFTGVKLYRAYQRTQKKANPTPTTN